MLGHPYDEIMSVMSSPLITSLSGVCVGYLLSNRHWKKQLDFQKHRVARGFYYEIEILENILKEILDKCKEENFNGTPFTSLYSIISKLYEDPNAVKLYTENGLFFHFRKEVFIYNDELIENILKFYHNMIEADKCYQAYIKLHDDGLNINSNLKKFKPLQLRYVEHLSIAYSTIPILKQLLKKECESSFVCFANIK